MELSLGWDAWPIAPDFSHLPTHILYGRARGSLRAKSPLWLEAGVPFLVRQEGQGLLSKIRRIPSSEPYWLEVNWEAPPGALWVVASEGQLFREALGQPGPGEFSWDPVAGRVLFSPQDAGREISLVAGVPLLGWGAVARPPVLSGRLVFSVGSGQITLYAPQMALVAWSLASGEDGVARALLRFLLLGDGRGRFLVAL